MMGNLLTALRNADAAGDVEAAKRIAAMIKAQQPQFQSESEIPIESEMGLPFAPKQQQPPPTIGEIASGGIEAAATMATGATGGALGYVGGILKQLPQEIIGGDFGTQESAGRVERSAMEGAEALTYAPRTETGRDIVQAIGEAAEPLVAVTPQLAGAMPLRGVRLPKMKIGAAKKMIAQEIREGNRNIVNIEKALAPSGKLIKNPNTKTAIKLLGDTDEARHAAILFEDMNKATKLRVNKMLDVIAKGRKFGDKYAMDNRPADVIGEGLAVRAKALNKIRKAANKELSSAIKTELSGKTVDVSGSINKFADTLQKEGVTFATDKAGKIKVNLENATIKLGDVLPKAELERLLNQLKTGTMSAEKAHKMKRFVREFVSYDDGLQVGAKTSVTLENAIKDLSTGIGDKLKTVSPKYAKANQKYSDVADALSKVSKQLKGIDLESDFAAQKLGALSKRIGSNLASREQIKMMVDEMDSALKKRGITFNDDVRGQVAALAKIEEIFGVERTQSPFSFQAGITKGVEAAVSPKVSALKWSAEKLQKMTELDFNARMKALRKLTEAK